MSKKQNKVSDDLTESEWRATAAWGRENVKRQRIGPLDLCSFRLSIDDWNVWIEWPHLEESGGK